MPGFKRRVGNQPHRIRMITRYTLKRCFWSPKTKLFEHDLQSGRRSSVNGRPLNRGKICLVSVNGKHVIYFRGENAVIKFSSIGVDRSLHWISCKSNYLTLIRLFVVLSTRLVFYWYPKKVPFGPNRFLKVLKGEHWRFKFEFLKSRFDESIFVKKLGL